MNIEIVDIKIPEGGNIIIGKTHFIKSVEDIYEAIVETAPHIKFGIAFNEASGDRLIRIEGNDDELKKIAVENAKNIGAGHIFIVAIKEGWPINILPRIKNISEVIELLIATANKCQVIVVETDLGRGVLGVIDGEKPLGIETEEDANKRKSFLRKIGYKR